MKQAFLFFLCISLSVTLVAQMATPNSTTVVESYGNPPLAFEANQGQTDPRVKFLSRGATYVLFLGNREAVLVLGDPRPKLEMQRLLDSKAASSPESDQSGSELQQHLNTTSHSAWTGFRIRLAGANVAPEVKGLDEMPGKSNYLMGADRRKWRINVPHYAKVQYKSIYPGVDLVYYINQGQLEYDFVVAPRVDPGVIRMSMRGLGDDARIQINPQGDLIVRSEGAEIRLHKPAAYQPGLLRGPGQKDRTFLDARYVLKGSQISFSVPVYDQSKPLIIDPALSYSTFLGGTNQNNGIGFDQGNSIAVDSSGNTYVVGQTTSLDFPVVAGSLETTSAAPVGCVALFGYEAFVTKLNPSGSALVYSTYLGGPGCAIGTGIAIDSAGNAYVTGSAGPGFPTTPQAFQTTYGGPGNTSVGDAFVAKLNATGTALVYSTYLGGFSGDIGNGIAVDAGGNAYVVGQTVSNDFPTFPSGGVCSDLSNSADFVTKLNANGSALVYSKCLGKPDIGYGLAVDSTGNAYVTGFGNAGMTASATGNCTLAGGGYAAKLNSDGTTAFVDCFPGTGRAIAVDSSGNTYLTGYTTSPNFPTTAGAFQTACNATCATGFSDAFVMKLDATGTKLLYSTYLGGNGNDLGSSIAVDQSGNAYLIGNTSSADFPLLNPTQAKFGGGTGPGDAFVTEINPNGSALLFSTFLGGSMDEVGTGIALAAGSFYVTGSTASADFPVTAAAFQTTFKGPPGVPGDAFVAKFGPPDFSIAASVPVPGTVSPGQSSSSTVTATSVAGFNTAISLTCSVQPSSVSAPGCSFTPTAVTPPQGGAITATLLITTQSPTATLASPSGHSGLVDVIWLPILGATLAIVDFGSRRRKRRSWLGLVVCGLLMTGMTFQSACGGGGSSGGSSGGTPKGNYTIAITGTSGSLSHSTMVTLIVQ